MRGEFLRAAAEPGGYAASGGLALAIAGHPDAIQLCRKEAETLHIAKMTTVAKLFDEQVAMIEGTGNIGALLSATEAVIAGDLRDPEARFFLALRLARFGGEDRALEILVDVVDRGYFPYDTFTRNPWLDPLRDRSDFREILLKAERGHQQARRAFIDAGGLALLGAETDR